MANPLKEKVLSGEVSIVEIDKKVSHILNVMFKLKMLGDEERQSGTYNTFEHRETAYKVAKEAIVLLKNDEDKLPLSKDIKKLLVIGDNAERIHSNGGGSAEIKALYEVTPLMALKSKLGGNCEVTFVRGYDSSKIDKESDLHWQETSLETKEDFRDQISEEIKVKREQLRDEAVKLASVYEHVLIFGGLNHDYDLEGQDRADIKLPRWRGFHSPGSLRRRKHK